MDELLQWGLQSDPVLDFFLAPLVAFVCGGLIGLNREFGRKAAGLRTHILVCVGCALFTDLSMYGFGPLQAPPRDPARLAANIVTGLGFIGAGAIWRQGVNTVGLTTAATIWITGAIGVASATGHYFHALGTTALALFTLTVLRRLEDRVRPHRPEAGPAVLVVEVERIALPEVLRRGEELLIDRGAPYIERHGFHLTHSAGDQFILHWQIGDAPGERLDQVVVELGSLAGVHAARWQIEQ